MSEKTTPPALHAYPWHADIQTRWMDNDCYGHVNNVVYYALFDTAVNQYLIQHAGLVPATSREIGVVVENHCQYFRSLSYPDLARVGVRVNKIGNTSVRYELAVFRNDEPDACAAGHFVHVYVDRNTRQPVPVPEQARQALRRLISQA